MHAAHIAATVTAVNNPFVPSVPKNGTPNLIADIKIIQALIGYTTVDAYHIISYHIIS